MAHALIAGMTQCGKTTLAKHLAKSMQKVVVYEVEYKTDWHTALAYHTTDIDDLLAFSKSNINCNIFIDDSEEATDRDRQYNFFATRARHFGHRCFFIMQRPVQVLPTIRHNCAAIYLFRINPQDAEALACDFNDETLLKAPSLKPGHFLCKPNPIAECKHLRLW